MPRSAGPTAPSQASQDYQDILAAMAGMGKTVRRVSKVRKGLQVGKTLSCECQERGKTVPGISPWESKPFPAVLVRSCRVGMMEQPKEPGEGGKVCHTCSPLTHTHCAPSADKWGLAVTTMTPPPLS